VSSNMAFDLANGVNSRKALKLAANSKDCEISMKYWMLVSSQKDVERHT